MNEGFEPRFEIVSAVEARIPEIHHGLASTHPFLEIQGSDGGTWGASIEIVRRELALNDQGVYVGFLGTELVGEELDDKVGSVGRGGGSRRAVEAVVRRDIGSAV